MPNHITNIVTFEGEGVEEVFEFVKDKDEEGHEILFSFNKIIPMPRDLEIASGSREMDAQDLLNRMEREPVLKQIVEDNMDMFFDHLEDYVEIPKDRDQEKFKAELKQYVKNRLEHGYTSWYNWCCDKWGTKWNAYDIHRSEEGNTIEFDTAWATPVPVMFELSKKFPNVKITVEFADEDLGANCGKYVLKEGKYLDVYDPSGEEALRFACEVKGCDYDEIVAEREEDV